MSSPNPENDSSSMFMQKGDGDDKPARSPNREIKSRRNSSETKHVDTRQPEIITVKDFFDFMKTAYQVYEHLEGDGDEETRIDWDEIAKLTVINHVIDQSERDLLQQSAFLEHKPIVSVSDVGLPKNDKIELRVEKRRSCSEIEDKIRKNALPPDAKVEMLGVWTEANLNCKLNDVINEGILDSILPYLFGYKKPTKTTSAYTPIIKRASATSTEIKKLASFEGFIQETESTDRLGRRKSIITAHETKINSLKHEGDVEIHVCDEVKGMKKDFRCPQKLLVAKMGYFADVTAGQRLEDMDISVHCDIQIFDWLMRWVKRDSILVADWPLLAPHNVVPILVSASFLQMEPLLQDCFVYCHAHMNEILKTSTNLACLSDILLTRLAAMYTNEELEGIKDRKDKIQSRLYCKMIISLAEPEPETLRGHYATLATLFKCNKCHKLLGRHIAEQVPCQPASMRIDRRGNIISMHNKDPSWSLNEYITWLYGELRSWRRVYWRLWADCHFLKCQLCDSYFPAYQMEWCSHHEQPAHMFTLEGGSTLAAGRYPCCGERAYRFETLTRNTGCQFREHVTSGEGSDGAVLELYARFRDIISMRPPQLVFPERLTRLVARALARPESPAACPSTHSLGSAAGPPAPGTAEIAPPTKEPQAKNPARPKTSKKKGAIGGGDSCSDGSEQDDSSDSDSSEQSAASPRSDEDAPRKQPALERAKPAKRQRVVGRQWVASLSARSNQDGQRRYEERAAKQMRSALARRVAPQTGKGHVPPGGVYARLEAEWRERHAGGAAGGGGGAGSRPRVQSSSRPRFINKLK